jgi:histone-lysine N-methyltransferase ASH1L
MPNCAVTSRQVLGTPRIGIFAGFQGVRAGAEVTIHYNFMPFPDAQVEVCYCGSETAEVT